MSTTKVKHPHPVWLGGLLSSIALKASAPALAAPIWSGVQNIVIDEVGGAYGTSVDLDLNGDSTFDIEFNEEGGNSTLYLDTVTESGNTLSATLYPLATGPNGLMTRLALGDAVANGSNGGNFQSKNADYGIRVGASADWVDEFIGFRFEDGGQIFNGWMGISSDANQLVIHDWAFENVSNAAINAGDGREVSSVPLPPAWALLAAGAIGLRTRRQKPLDLA